MDSFSCKYLEHHKKNHILGRKLWHLKDKPQHTNPLILDYFLKTSALSETSGSVQALVWYNIIKS